MRILIAEDETIIRLDLRELLEGAGFEICAEARDGVEAVELARSEQPSQTPWFKMRHAYGRLSRFSQNRRAISK